MQVSEFMDLPLETRAAAYQRARSKVGDGVIKLVDLCRAAEEIASEAA